MRQIFASAVVCLFVTACLVPQTPAQSAGTLEVVLNLYENIRTTTTYRLENCLLRVEAHLLDGPTETREFRISRRRCDALEKAVSAVNWPALSGIYKNPDVYDGFRAVVTWRGLTDSREVEVVNGSPPGLARVARELNRVLPEEYAVVLSLDG